jgi:hypothetical protein
MGRVVYGASCLWGELTVGRVVVGRILIGRVVRGASFDGASGPGTTSSTPTFGGKEGAAGKWALETLVTGASKPNKKITSVSQIIPVHSFLVYCLSLSGDH